MTEPCYSLDLLFVRACTVAERVSLGQIRFIDGVDLCYSAADWSGVIDHYGDDVVQNILAQAFMGVPRGVAE